MTSSGPSPNTGLKLKSSKLEYTRSSLFARSNVAEFPAIDDGSGVILYVSFIGNETTTRFDWAIGHVLSILRSNNERKDQSRMEHRSINAFHR